MGIPEYVERAFEALRYFSQEYRHRGLALALGTEKNIKRAVFDIGDHNPDEGRIIRPELKRLFEEYRDRPVLYTPDIYDVFAIMTNEQDHIDSLLSINPSGHIIEIDGFLVSSKRAYRKLTHHDLEWGTRHWNCAAASTYRSVTTMALSERRGTVTTFRNGQIVDELCYRPRR